MDKKLYYTGIWAYAVLLVLAVVFYKERTILLDNSLFLFEILKDDGFCVQRYRLIAALPQIFPVLAAKLSLSLKWVMIAYSAGFVIYHVICYLLCGVVLKNYRLGLALLLVNTLLVTHTFFWGLSELLLGISLMFVFFALITDTEKKIPAYILLPLLVIAIVIIALSHPLIVFPFLFSAIYIWLNKQTKVDRKTLLISVLLFFVVLILKTLFPADDYENESASSLRNFKTLFPNYLSLYSNTHFVSNWFSIYYWIPVALAMIVFTYIRSRSWLKLLLVICAFAGYTQIVNVAYPTSLTPDFYMENMYMVLSVFLVLPLLYDVFPQMNRKLVFVLFVLVLCSSFYRIYNQHFFYSNRIAWYRDYLEKYPGEKMMVSMGDKPREIILMPWGATFEFWLLSTLEKDKTASIIIHENVDDIGWAYNNYSSFVTIWGIHKYSDLNPRYFKFTDSSRHYSVYKDR